MVIKLDNSKQNIATQIFGVFQASYQVEAELIGVTEFPPLQRGITDILNSGNNFYGFIIEDDLAAVIEIENIEKQLDIHSLTVAPAHFRKGIANKLLSYVLANLEFSSARVETAVLNAPAIRLYEKHGFTEFKRWTPSHGIEKLAMER